MPTTISRRTLMTAAAGAAALTALPGRGIAGDYPTKDITYIIPYNPGGMSDNISRILGEQIMSTAGVNVVNDYRPGAGGAIAANYFSHAEPNGYTIMQGSNSFFAIIPFVTKVEYDPETDFTPVVMVGSAPMVIACNPSVPVETLPDLIAYAKENPNKLAFGSAGKGTVGHMCGVWLQDKAGIELVHIPYKGTPAAMQAGVSDEVQVVFGPESAELILSGKMKGLAIMGDMRWDNLPDLPTTSEVGLDGWAPRSWHTVIMPSGTPDEVKQDMAALLNGILETPDVQKRIAGLGLIPSTLSMEELRAAADADKQGFGKIIEDAGLAQQG